MSRTRTHQELTLLLAGVGLLVLAGCVPATPGGASPTALAPSGTEVALPVSDWSPQSGSAFAWSLQGTLVSSGDCIRLKADDGSTVTPVWPSGHTAYRVSSVITVFDGEGREVARTGQRVDLVGGYGDAPYPNECTRDRQGTFLVQEDILRGY